MLFGDALNDHDRRFPLDSQLLTTRIPTGIHIPSGWIRWREIPSIAWTRSAGLRCRYRRVVDRSVWPRMSARTVTSPRSPLVTSSVANVCRSEYAVIRSWSDRSRPAFRTAVRTANCRASQVHGRPRRFTNTRSTVQGFRSARQPASTVATSRGRGMTRV